MIRACVKPLIWYASLPSASLIDVYTYIYSVDFKAPLMEEWLFPVTLNWSNSKGY
jgi:hypothetical protein